jgi:hypothetical protein
MSGIHVPRLAKGRGYKGPEHYGCYNTGMAPAIFHSRTGKYVVGPEIPCHDAMRAGMTLFAKVRIVNGTDPRRKVWILKSRKTAVSKFLVLCGAQIIENEKQRQAHKAAAQAAATGDLAAALALGDF